MIFLLLLITQIIVESLPISSSGHVKLVENISLKLYPEQNYNLIPKSLEYFFHGPTILILIIFFFKDIIYLLSNFSKNFDFIYYWLSLVFIADFITVIFYFLFNYFEIKNINFISGIYSSYLSYFSGFIITIFLLLSLKFLPNNLANLSNLNTGLTKLSYKHSVILGVVQGISLLPGISRLASTFVVACWLGATYQTAFYFSCAIQFPLICAGFLKGCYFVYTNPTLLANILKPAWLFSSVTILSTIISYFALHTTYLLLISGYGYYFGYYMIIPAVLALIFNI